MRVIFGIFPLLAIPVIIYNLMAFTHGGGGADAAGVAISMARQISDRSEAERLRVRAAEYLARAVAFDDRAKPLADRGEDA